MMWSTNIPGIQRAGKNMKTVDHGGGISACTHKHSDHDLGLQLSPTVRLATTYGLRYMTLIYSRMKRFNKSQSRYSSKIPSQHCKRRTNLSKALQIIRETLWERKRERKKERQKERIEIKPTRTRSK